MNKQGQETEKTASNNTNIPTILFLLLAYRSSMTIRQRYRLNTHHITVLIGCYFYSKQVNDTFTISSIVSFVTSYNHNRIKRYINDLIGCGLITQAGMSGTKINKYTITQVGLNVINELSNKADQIIYDFCRKYNIEL